METTNKPGTGKTIKFTSKKEIKVSELPQDQVANLRVMNRLGRKKWLRSYNKELKLKLRNQA